MFDVPSSEFQVRGSLFMGRTSNLELHYAAEVLMQRIPRFLVAVLSFLSLCEASFAQAAPGVEGVPPLVRPGGPAGTAVPGLPAARDPRGGPQTGTARVSGRVVATQTGTPLRRAQIMLFLKDYVVVLLPAEQQEPIVAARWIRTVRPDSNGRDVAVGLRPGRYVAVAVEALEHGRQFAPEFQEQLRRQAREIPPKEGESATLDLKLTPGL
jgi:hypothetical protein